MDKFTVHTIESAPEGSKETLKTVQENLGGIPHLAAAMAESPSLVKGFFTLRSIYLSGTFSEKDIQILSLANAVSNHCKWCIAFHSFFAEKTGISVGDIQAIRNAQLPSDPRAKALVRYTKALIESRGQTSADEYAAFRQAGFSKAQALEVVVGIAFSTMANYAGHITKAPLDEMFAAHQYTALAR